MTKDNTIDSVNNIEEEKNFKEKKIPEIEIIHHEILAVFNKKFHITCKQFLIPDFFSRNFPIRKINS